MFKHITSFLLFLILLVFSNLTIAENNKTGKIVHENLCKNCHINITGGDGSIIYNNFNKNINNKEQLMDSITYYYKKSSKINNNKELIKLYDYINNIFYNY